jgi:dihydrofolate synthase / folylpolyglutamate synthase
MRYSSLADWLAWLEQSHPKEIDLGLVRIRKVAARLELLTPRAKIITVAGTNGKGSCSTATAGLLRAAGFKVGLYTSPHLLHYAERIQVNGKAVADEYICAAFEKIADAAAEISLTYFEYGTLAALIIFAQQNVDYMVLEVGLGGRLDAVNILDADVAVITSIAIDHQEWLGNDRETIGAEKAGILREEQLFICADEAPPDSVVHKASQLKTLAFYIGKDFSFFVDEGYSHIQWQGKTREGKSISLPSMRVPSLPLQSMAAAVQTFFLLGHSLSTELIEHSLLNLVLLGRHQQVVYRDRSFILDVAHNPAATAYFAKRLSAEPFMGRTFAIVAMMRDKDRSASLANLIDIVDQWCLLDLDVPRAANVVELTENLAGLGKSVYASGNSQLLMQRVLSQAQAEDRILVFGSFFTVAEVLNKIAESAYDSRGGL